MTRPSKTTIDVSLVLSIAMEFLLLRHPLRTALAFPIGFGLVSLSILPFDAFSWVSRVIHVDHTTVYEVILVGLWFTYFPLGMRLLGDFGTCGNLTIDEAINCVKYGEFTEQEKAVLYNRIISTTALNIEFTEKAERQLQHMSPR